MALNGAERRSDRELRVEEVGLVLFRWFGLDSSTRLAGGRETIGGSARFDALLFVLLICLL